MEENKATIELYKMLEKTTNILKDLNIKHWADGGTYLGAVRHSGIIPWDDDIDIGVLENSLNKNFSLIKRKLKNEGYGIVKQHFGYKIYPIKGDKIKIDPWVLHCNKIKKKYKTISRSRLYKEASKTYKKSDKTLYHNYKYPFLDIFEYKNRDQKLYTKGDDSWWTNTCYYDTMKLNKLKEKKFGNFRLNTMPDYKRYFTSCYGKDWNKYGYTSEWNHRKEKHSKNKEKRKFKLTKKNRVPKKPFS